MAGRLLSTVWLSVLLTVAAAAAPAGEEPLSLEAQAAVIEKVSPSIVRVEYTLTTDQGEQPENHAWLIRDERPLEIRGWLLSPTQVIIPDPDLHPRFIKGIAIRFGKQLVEARVTAYPKAQHALILDLKEPLKDAKPLAFDAARKGPFLAVFVGQDDEEWTVNVTPFEPNLAVAEDGRKFLSAGLEGLIVDRSGAPVGLPMLDELPLDDSWKGSPLGWPALGAEDMAKALADLEKRAALALPRVSLKFRSPQKEAAGRRWSRGAEDDEGSAEKNLIGVLLDERRVLVLAEIKPAITARLEKISIHQADGQAVKARFAGSLADYGGFLAEAETPLAGAAAFPEADLRSFRRTMLLSAHLNQQGEKRVSRFLRCRIHGFHLGWRRQLYPYVSGREETTFLFDFQGRLLAMPISRRNPVAIEGQGYSGRDEQMLTPSALLRAALADPAKAFDAGNVPLKPEEENRLAWVGAMLQPLDKELARANNVAEQTKDGLSGALVSYVYPGSPAEKAGIKAGAVLLRLHVAGQPLPLEIRVDDDGDAFGGEPFPWDKLDAVPDRVYDQIPKPWPTVGDSLTRALTELGFGRKYSIEYFADGKLRTAELEVVPSPPHYDSAPRFKSEPLGLTVRELTFEVRRYFQMKPEDAGVIVSNIKPGSKISVAGIKPYEVIVQVNGNPVRTVKDFEAASAGQEELRLAVKRMNKERQAKVKLSAAPGAPDATPKSSEPKKPAEPAEE